MFEDSDLSYAFRPGIVEALIRHEKEEFKTNQIESLRSPTEVGKVAQSLVEEGYMEVTDEAQHKRYRFSDNMREELETRKHDNFAEIMKYAKDKWEDVLQDKTEDYDLEDLREDVPEGLHISETNNGVRKFLELRSHPLNNDTKQYLADVSIIADTESMELKADYIDIVMMENYFEEM